jgi:hypothetical protein
MLERCKSKPKILVYHGDVSDKRKKTITNASEEWDNYNCILTTSSITVGINYEGSKYDKIYLLISPSVNNPRDVIQTSMRIRNTNENIIEIFFFDFTKKRTIEYPVWYNKMDNKIYKFIIDKSIEEKQTNFTEVFFEFCNLTNYDFSNMQDKIKMLEDKNDNFKNDFTNKFYELHQSKVLMPYEKIEPISEEVAKQIEQEAVFIGKATQQDKFVLSRFYFDCYFNNLDNNDKAYIWNNRTKQFFKNKNDKLIKQILEDNKVKKLEELNVNKINTSEETEKMIKSQFKSTIKNKNQRVVKIINCILGCEVIKCVKKSEKSNSTHYKFTELFENLNTISEKYYN